MEYTSNQQQNKLAVPSSATFKTDLLSITVEEKYCQEMKGKIFISMQQLNNEYFLMESIDENALGCPSFSQRCQNFIQIFSVKDVRQSLATIAIDCNDQFSSAALKSDILLILTRKKIILYDFKCSTLKLIKTFRSQSWKDFELFDTHVTHGQFGLINVSNGSIILISCKDNTKAQLRTYESNFCGKLLKLKKSGYYYFEDGDTEQGAIIKLKFSKFLMKSKLIKKISPDSDVASFQIKGQNWEKGHYQTKITLSTDDEYMNFSLSPAKKDEQIQIKNDFQYIINSSNKEGYYTLFNIKQDQWSIAHDPTQKCSFPFKQSISQYNLIVYETEGIVNRYTLQLFN